MTLNVTVATSRCIYQSADYQLLDLITLKPFVDFKTQKIVLAGTSKWSATVCFAGVGRTHNLDISEWLAERVALIERNDPFERLIDELLLADKWLSGVSPPHNRHSFSVGAFVGSEPVFALVSNFEEPFSLPAETASPNLSVFILRPREPKTFVSGQKHAVMRWERRRLAALADSDPDAERMYSALAELNRLVATRTTRVSSACFTTSVRLTGEGGGIAHEVGDVPFLPGFAIPPLIRESVMQILDERFGPGRARLKSISNFRRDASDEYHETQLREKPEDASVHSSYGAFLQDNKGDLAGAEREYRKAIELDGNHVDALGNLAYLLGEKGDADQANQFFLRALHVGPGNENVSYNYARFLVRVHDDLDAARDVLDEGIANNPESARLILFRAEIDLLGRKFSEAVSGFRRAREKGASQDVLEAGYSCALHLSGAPIGECIAAYRLAVLLNPKNAALKLNLAQLLFVKDDDTEANKQLLEAMGLELDASAQLEAHLYQLCHTSFDPAAVLLKIRQLLVEGARLRWDVSMNIEVVRRANPLKASLIETIRQVIVGEGEQALLDEVLARWPERAGD